MASLGQAQAAIEVSDLEVYRRGRRVLPSISLTVRRGATTGLVGPSGSGKTTLMRAIVGVQVVRSGHVMVLGKLAGTPGLRRRVAYVTQAPSIYGDLTIRENLRYFGRILDVPCDRIDATITEVGLANRESQVVRTLSGGERSRASLAVALLADPEVLVLDEPTVGLDPVLRRDLWRTFHSLAEKGAAVLVSTHVMDEADRCEELILMRDGHIVAAGSPLALRRQTGAEDLESAFLALAEGAA